MSEGERVFHIRFADETKKEIRRLGHAAAAEILAAVEKKLSRDPEGYGKPLRRDLAGYYKLAVGQWRVVYHVESGRVLVLVLAVGKRAEGDRENVYDHLTRADLDSRSDELRRTLTAEDAGEERP